MIVPVRVCFYRKVNSLSSALKKLCRNYVGCIYRPTAGVDLFNYLNKNRQRVEDYVRFSATRSHALTLRGMRQANEEVAQPEGKSTSWVTALRPIRSRSSNLTSQMRSCRNAKAFAQSVQIHRREDPRRVAPQRSVFLVRGANYKVRHPGK